MTLNGFQGILFNIFIYKHGRENRVKLLTLDGAVVKDAI